MVAVLAGALLVGTVWHEVVGHGLVAVVCGGRIDQVEILGLELYPRLHCLGWQHHYGSCGTAGVDSAAACALVSLGGSMSTWLVSFIAMVLLWVRRWGPCMRIVLVCLAIWWIDLLTYTLPSWGLPRSAVWGQDYYSEPYEAAVALGVPGWLFQVFAVASSVLLCSGLLIHLIRLRKSTDYRT